MSASSLLSFQTPQGPLELPSFSILPLALHQKQLPQKRRVMGCQATSCCPGEVQATSDTSQDRKLAEQKTQPGSRKEAGWADIGVEPAWKGSARARQLSRGGRWGTGEDRDGRGKAVLLGAKS